MKSTAPSALMKEYLVVVIQIVRLGQMNSRFDEWLISLRIGQQEAVFHLRKPLLIQNFGSHYVQWTPVKPSRLFSQNCLKMVKEMLITCSISWIASCVLPVPDSPYTS